MPLRITASSRRLDLRHRAWLLALVSLATTWVTLGCAPAGTGPQSRLGSLAVEPELPSASATTSADPHRRWVPEVIAAPKPFRLADVAGTPTAVAATMGQTVEPFVPPAPVRLASAMADAVEPAHLPQPVPASPQTAEIRDMLAGYLQAFNRHDAAAAAGHWAIAGESLNLDSGESTRGREAVRQVFASLFEIDAEAAMDIDISGIRPLREDVAVVDGVSRVSYADGEAAGSRFSAVLIREAGQWQLANVREAACAVPDRPRRPLEELAWLVGSWENACEGVTASSQCSWSGDRAYLTRHHIISASPPASEPPRAGDGRIPGLLSAAAAGRRELSEIIAWDPERESIRSWIFSADGRFAEGTWSRDGDSWVVRIEGRGLDAGREARCTLATDGPDGLAVESDGESLAGLLPPSCGFTRTAR